MKLFGLTTFVKFYIVGGLPKASGTLVSVSCTLKVGLAFDKSLSRSRFEHFHIISMFLFTFGSHYLFRDTNQNQLSERGTTVQKLFINPLHVIYPFRFKPKK